MIITFADENTSQIWSGHRSRKLPADMQHRALAKLALLKRVKSLDELRHPPGNSLHALSGNRSGQHALSINKQWRICFVWKDGHAHDVEIVDYH